MPSTAAGQPAPPQNAAAHDFAAVAEHVAPRLYRIALRMCGNPADAEDLVQDTLLQGFRKWQQFEGRASASTWLYTIAARLCQRRHRRRAGEPAHLESLSALLPTPGEPIIADRYTDRGPLEEHIRREAERAVGDAVAALPPHFRLPLVLADIAELSPVEIGRVLGLKEATVKTRIHRGRLLVRRSLLSRLPVHPAPPVDHERRVCLDLLQAKLEALDRREPFPFSPAALCARCQSLFATLDLGRDVCPATGAADLPPSLLDLLRVQARSGRRSSAARVRGRPPRRPVGE